MPIGFWAVEIVVGVDKEILTLFTGKHGRWEMCAIEGPSVYSTAGIEVIANEDLVIGRHE